MDEKNVERRVGLLCPAGPEDVLPADFARRAESLGFESLWVGEHPAVPRDITRSYEQLVGGEVPNFYTNVADPWMTLAHIAGATTRIGLGTAVGLVTLRHPLLLAKTLATLDRQSGGRVTVGAGAGWLIEELDLFDVAFDSRFERMREIVEAMRRVWTEEEPEYHGEHVDFPPILSRYPPIQRPIPVLCGVHGPRGMRLAAKWADGWLPVSSGPEKLAADLARLAAYCDAEGRDPGALDITIMAGVDEETPADEVLSLFEAGASRVLLAVGTVTTARTVLEESRARHPLAPDRYDATLEAIAGRFLP
ncbi:MAG: TIGR03619 family F420-dependent LLM class oxidoreductase [bacterium]|nr:LLM class F420-dependent oxidoreductase [Deltaproteobacteria bacterium]MCP4903979.1 TIGR03619 family F420-dependent LLM class oxidoreductase [bacterium]